MLPTELARSTSLRSQLYRATAMVVVLLVAFVPLVIIVPPLASQLIAFILLFGGLVALPGFFVARRLLPGLPSAAQLTAGIVLGESLCVLSLALTTRLGFSTWGFCVPLVVFGVLEVARPGRQPFSLPRPDPLFLTLLTVSVVLSYLCGVWPTLPPTVDHTGLIYQDSVWTIGNTISVARYGLPLLDFRLAGSSLGYHVAQNLAQAGFVALGIEAVPLHLWFEQILDKTILASVAWVGSRTFFSAGRAAAATMTTLVLFTDGFITGEHSSLYWNNLSYAYSLPPFLLFHFVWWAPHQVGNRRGALVLGITAFLAFASKGTLLMLIPVAAAGAEAWRALRNRRLETAAGWRLIAIFLAGVLAWVLIFRAPDGAGYGLMRWPVPDNSRVLTLLSGLGPMGKVLFQVYHVGRPFILNALAVLASAPGLLALFVCHRRGEPYLWFFATTSVGLSAVFNFVGGASYFILYPQVLLMMLVVRYWPSARLHTLQIGVLVSVVVMGIGSFANTLRRVGTTWGAPATASRTTWDDRATLDVDEMAGLVWLKENSPAEASFATNRRFFRHEIEKTEFSRDFLYSTFSQRQAWVEGEAFIPLSRRPEAEARWVQVNAFFQEADPELRFKRLLELPVDYVIECLRFANTSPLIPALRQQVVFENGSIRIFQKPKR